VALRRLAPRTADRVCRIVESTARERLRDRSRQRGKIEEQDERGGESSCPCVVASLPRAARRSISGPARDRFPRRRSSSIRRAGRAERFRADRDRAPAEIKENARSRAPFSGPRQSICAAALSPAKRFTPARVSVSACVRACVCVCVRARACMRARARVDVRESGVARLAICVCY